MLLQEIHFRSRDTERLKIRGWKKIFHAKGNQKKAGVVILLSDKIGFKTCYKRQRRKLHNDQEINSGRRCNNSKYTYTYLPPNIHKNISQINAYQNSSTQIVFQKTPYYIKMQQYLLSLEKYTYLCLRTNFTFL